MHCRSLGLDSVPMGIASRTRQQTRALQEGADPLHCEVGQDYDGHEYSMDLLRHMQASPSWYSVAARYWLSVEPTANGVLGGNMEVALQDESSSKQYIDRLQSAGLLRRTATALDVGAGIGRVTLRVLSQRFEQVDLLEPNRLFLETARQTLLAANPSFRGGFIASSMQDFRPDNGSVYDCVWIQWVIAHLRDEDFATFLAVHVRACLRPGTGVVVVKDNVADEAFVVNREASLVTRTAAHLEKLLQDCDLVILDKQRQRGFPDRLVPVYFYALRFADDGRRQIRR